MITYLDGDIADDLLRVGHDSGSFEHSFLVRELVLGQVLFQVMDVFHLPPHSRYLEKHKNRKRWLREVNPCK